MNVNLTAKLSKATLKYIEQNKSIIYRPNIYNLYTRTVTFPDQEKLLEKIDLRYLKRLKTKKLNTKNPQIKHFPCSKYVRI